MQTESKREDHEDSDDTEECEVVSQLADSLSQDCLANHASIIHKRRVRSLAIDRVDYTH